MNEIRDFKLNLVKKFSVIRNRKIGICCSLFILNPFELILFGLKNGEIVFYSYPNINLFFKFFFCHFFYFLIVLFVFSFLS